MRFDHALRDLVAEGIGLIEDAGQAAIRIHWIAIAGASAAAVETFVVISIDLLPGRVTIPGAWQLSFAEPGAVFEMEGDGDFFEQPAGAICPAGDGAAGGACLLLHDEVAVGPGWRWGLHA